MEERLEKRRQCRCRQKLRSSGTRFVIRILLHSVCRLLGVGDEKVEYVQVEGQGDGDDDMQSGGRRDGDGDDSQANNEAKPGASGMETAERRRLPLCLQDLWACGRLGLGWHKAEDRGQSAGSGRLGPVLVAAPWHQHILSRRRLLPQVYSTHSHCTVHISLPRCMVCPRLETSLAYNA